MDKSPDAFRTISEVADDLDLPQHVLRFWETRFAQIKPLKRGGGRRYYRPGDVDLLRGIRHLLYEEGYTIKGVQKILRENGVQFAVAIGTGDLSALQEMTKRNTEASAEQAEADRKAEATVRPSVAEPTVPVEPDVMVGHARPKARSMFGFSRTGDDDVTQPATAAAGVLSRDNRQLLQEALFDLLECKRLLDQAR